MELWFEEDLDLSSSMKGLLTCGLYYVLLYRVSALQQPPADWPTSPRLQTAGSVLQAAVLQCHLAPAASCCTLWGLYAASKQNSMSTTTTHSINNYHCMFIICALIILIIVASFIVYGMCNVCNVYQLYHKVTVTWLLSAKHTWKP